MDIQQPSGWSACLLEEIALVLDYRRIPINNSNRQKRNQGKEQAKLFPYFGATGQAGWIDDFIFDEEIILLGEDGVPFLDPYKIKAYMVQEKCWVNNHAHVLKPIEEACDSRYLLHYLNQFDYRGLVTGSTRLKLNQKAMRGMEINLAPLNEQRRIAVKLDTTLAAVEACKQKLNNASETIQRFRQSVLAAAVSGELTREWREERGIEGEWEMTTLANLIQRIDAGLNLKCDERIPQHEERGLIKISAVSWGEFNEDESKTLPPSAEVKEENKIKPGDLLISRANTIELVGSCVIVKAITKNLYLPDKVLRLEAHENLKKWLLINLRSPGGRSQIESLSSGNQLSMRNLSQKNMLSIKLPVPTLEELDEIYRKSDALFDQADAFEEQIQSALSAASRLTPSLLAKAFRGELVDQDPNDEPASVLLARIKAQREAEAAAKKPVKRGRKKKADTAQPVVPEGIADNHLAKVLEECGALSERALLAASELAPGVFQLQLSKELKTGALKQVDVDGEAAYADAAWEEEG